MSFEYTPILAKIESECPYCAEKIEIGDHIRPNRQLWYHADCLVAKHKDEQAAREKEVK